MFVLSENIFVCRKLSYPTQNYLITRWCENIVRGDQEECEETKLRSVHDACLCCSGDDELGTVDSGDVSLHSLMSPAHDLSPLSSLVNFHPPSYRLKLRSIVNGKLSNK